MYKVVIPCAGIGSRVGPYTKFINKALLTINNRPAITHIIDKFPVDVEVVILLGYKGDYIRQVLNAFYHDRRKFTFVEVDKYDGSGAGLGYSLRCAKAELRCPFIFVSNDTLIPDSQIDIDPSKHGDWMGYFRNDGTFDSSQYRTLNISNFDQEVTRINPKGVLCENIYVGVAGIANHADFWDTMNDDDAIEVGESYGLKSLRNIKAVPFDRWCDTGNLKSLEKTKKLLDKSEYNILEKESEAIWFTDDEVIKFSIDEKFISDRYARQDHLPSLLFPHITHVDKNLYTYEKIRGKILSDVIDVPTFRRLFDTMQETMWKHTGDVDLKRACVSFYKDKTYERVNQFHSTFEVMDRREIINGRVVPTTMNLLDKIDWDKLCDTYVAAPFHGDFHNENILITPNGSPILLDWRQNFGGDIQYGDVYYDFAKFHHGLIVSHEMVKKNFFSIKYSNGEIAIDILRPNKLVEVEAAFMSWLEMNEYDVQKVKTLTALIFLNIAALHEYPYSLFLYYLGRYMLARG